MAIIESLRYSIKKGKLMLHSATLNGSRVLHSDDCWCETKDTSLPYVISNLAEPVLYYDTKRMDSKDAVQVLLTYVEKELDSKHKTLLETASGVETKLSIIRAKLAKK